MKAKLGTFTMGQAAKLTGIAPHNLQNWCWHGLVQPSLNLGAGRGMGKRWTLRDLVGLKTIQELRNQGVSLQKVRRLTEVLQEIKGSRRTLDALAQSRLIVMPDGVVSLKTKEQLIDLLTGQHVMGSIVMVDMQPVVAEIQSKVEQFEAARRLAA